MFASYRARPFFLASRCSIHLQTLPLDVSRCHEGNESKRKVQRHRAAALKNTVAEWRRIEKGIAFKPRRVYFGRQVKHTSVAHRFFALCFVSNLARVRNALAGASAASPAKRRPLPTGVTHSRGIPRHRSVLADWKPFWLRYAEKVAVVRIAWKRSRSGAISSLLKRTTKRAARKNKNLVKYGFCSSRYQHSKVHLYSRFLPLKVYHGPNINYRYQIAEISFPRFSSGPLKIDIKRA